MNIEKWQESSFIAKIDKISWDYDTGIAELEKGVLQLGLPTFLEPHKYGFAIWIKPMLVTTHNTLQLFKVELSGTPVVTRSEYPPVRCMWTVSVKYEVQNECFEASLKIHDGLIYDAQFRTLSARTSSFWKSIMLLAKVTGITRCMTPEHQQAVSREILASLGSADSEPVSIKSTTMLHNNLKHQPGNSMHINNPSFLV